MQAKSLALNKTTIETLFFSIPKCDVLVHIKNENGKMEPIICLLQFKEMMQSVIPNQTDKGNICINQHTSHNYTRENRL